MMSPPNCTSDGLDPLLLLLFASRTVRLCMHVCMYVYVRVHVCVCVCACVCACVRACVLHACVHVRVHACTCSMQVCGLSRVGRRRTVA